MKTSKTLTLKENVTEGIFQIIIKAKKNRWQELNYDFPSMGITIYESDVRKAGGEPSEIINHITEIVDITLLYKMLTKEMQIPEEKCTEKSSKKNARRVRSWHAKINFELQSNGKDNQWAFQIYVIRSEFFRVIVPYIEHKNRGFLNLKFPGSSTSNKKNEGQGNNGCFIL